MKLRYFITAVLITGAVAGACGSATSSTPPPVERTLDAPREGDCLVVQRYRAIAVSCNYGDGK